MKDNAVSPKLLNNSVMKDYIFKLLICPTCRGKLRLEPSYLGCINCGKEYILKGGVPVLLSDLSKSEEEQLSFTDHMYLSETIGNQYNEYVKRIFFDVANENYFLPLLLAKIKPESIVLDVGCGGGNVARQIVDTHANIVNMDISLKAIEFALASVNSPKSSFMQGSLLNIPIEDVSVDIIIAYFVLHHIEDIKKAISEIKRVLKPGGHFICLEPTARVTWFELWLNFFKIPSWVKNPLNEIYLKMQKSFAYEGGTLGIECPKREEFQKHFFKSIDGYEQILKEYNFLDTKLKNIFLEF